MPPVQKIAGLNSDGAAQLYAARAAAPLRCTQAEFAAIRADCPYQTLAALLLGDPARRAILRTLGVEETFVDGPGSDLEKLRAYCAQQWGAPDSIAAMQDHAILELALGISRSPEAERIDEIFVEAGERLLAKDITPRTLLALCGVGTLLVASAPTDSLSRFAGREPKALPLFCPDALLSPALPPFFDTVLALSGKAPSLSALQKALGEALDRFSAHGCRVAVHTALPEGFCRPDPYHAEQALRKRMVGEVLTGAEQTLLACQMWRMLGQEYVRRGFALELATGGADAGLSENLLRPAPLHTDYAAMQQLFCYLKECNALPRIALYLSAPTEVAEAVRLAGSYPSVGEGVPQISIGIVCGSEAQERALLTACAALLPLHTLAGAFTDFRLPRSLADTELFARRMCNFLAEHGGRMPENALLHTVRRLTGEALCAFHRLEQKKS